MEWKRDCSFRSAGDSSALRSVHRFNARRSFDRDSGNVTARPYEFTRDRSPRVLSRPRLRPSLVYLVLESHLLFSQSIEISFARSNRPKQNFERANRVVAAENSSREIRC